MQRHEKSYLTSYQKTFLKDETTPKPGSIWKDNSGSIYIVRSLSFCKVSEDVYVNYYCENSKMPMDWTMPLHIWQSYKVYNGKDAVPIFELLSQQ